jgi:hypothetical protein
MPADSWKLAPGLNNVGSYQVSGKPFAKGGITVPASGSDVGTVVRFPNVTKWVQVEMSPITPDGTRMRMAFSKKGLAEKGDAYFILHNSSSFQRPLDLKVSELWFMVEAPGSRTAEISLVAGLTNILAGSTNTATSASVNGQWVVNGITEAGGPNWSGSLGVS